MKAYRVKVIQRHSGFVWVEADSEDDACEIAAGEVDTEMDWTETAYVTETRDEIPENER